MYLQLQLQLQTDRRNLVAEDTASVYILLQLKLLLVLSLTMRHMMCTFTAVIACEHVDIH